MNATRLGRRVATPVVGTAVAVVALAGVAGAYYQSTLATSGTGSAKTASLQTVTFTVTGVASSAGLYPGGAGADLTVTVANPYGQAITVQSLASAGTVTATGGTGTCTTTGITVATPGGLPATVDASSTRTLTLTGAVTMGLTADSGCQGATFTIPLKVTGQL